MDSTAFQELWLVVRIVSIVETCVKILRPLFKKFQRKSRRMKAA